MFIRFIFVLIASFVHRLFVTKQHALVYLEKTCGQVLTGRIIGGFESPLYGWPWIASVETINGINFCGGVLISPRHILTAAHCMPVYKGFAPYILRASVGASVIGVGFPYYVLKVDIHPDYGKKSVYHSDIAILTLTQDVDFKGGLRMVCLPDEQPSSDDLVALGWGWTSSPKGNKVDHLHQVTLHRLSSNECQVYGHLWSDETMICAGYLAGGKDSCKGDSGGPLLQKGPSGSWIVQGIVSYGKGCATGHFPGVYTRVYAFRNWINKIVFSRNF